MPAAELQPMAASRFADGPAASPGFLLWHVTHAWQRAVAAALRPLDLTHVQFVLLACVWWLEEQGCTPNQLQLARQAGTDVKMTSQVVRKLEAKGLIERGVDPADTRARRVQATPAGARLAQRAIVAVEDVDGRFFARETDAATAVLQRLVGAQARPGDSCETLGTLAHQQFTPLASAAGPEGDPRATDAGQIVNARTDLTTHEPRGLGEELEGYAWLPRMLDKARAALAGTAGRYQFGCPVDHTCMARLGITPELILDLAARHPDDHAVLRALRAHGIPSAAEAWFDGQMVEDELQHTGNYLRVREREELPEGDSGRVFSGAEHGAGISVVLIAAAPGQAQAPHSHTVEEVVVVQKGSATFFLGQQQARTVREDEIVRIPAGVPHRWLAEQNGLHALAAYGAAEIVTEPA